MYRCKSATVTVYICTVLIALAFNILLFFSLSTSLSLFLSVLTLTSRSFFLHWSLLLSRVSPQPCYNWSPHLSLLTPITAAFIAIAIFFSLFDGFGILISGFWWSATLLLSRVSPQPCHHQSPHSLLLMPIVVASPIAVAIFFLCLMILGFWSVDFDGFDKWFWWFWLVDFDGFDKWVLMILISGFRILMGGLMMEAGLMIAAALFLLYLIVDGG